MSKTKGRMDVISKTFLDLVHTHQGIIYKICRVYAHTPDDQDDLFQEVLLNAWKSYPRFEGASKFSTWLYRVALNTALMYKRKQQRWIVAERVEDGVLENMAPEKSEDTEPLRRLESAITQLEPVEKALIVLYLEEVSYADMAVIMGLTESNVGVKINRIKKQLKQIMEAGNHGKR